MSQDSPDPDENDALEVLRAVWAAEDQTGADLDEDCSPTKNCKNMRDVSFDGFAEPGSDLTERGASGSPARASSTPPAAASATWSSVRLSRALNSVRDRRADRPPRRPATSPTAGCPPRCSSRCRSDRPILLEGEVGVGKTEVAKVLAAVLDRRLIRLQCYEGIDTNQALYEWDYARQMLQIRALSERQLDDEARSTSSSARSSCSSGRCSTRCAPATGPCC